jgi:alpha-beta hydrolase superfamily lysophospholipase
MRRKLIAVALATVLAVTVAGPGAGTAAATGRKTIIPTIGGADVRVELPQRWNGTLVLFSHGYWPTDFAPEEIWLANRPPELSRTEDWLLDHGYALAASNFTGVTGFQVENALRDQIELLDWFDANVGHPHRTISYGMSMGANIAVQLAERNPHRFAGVATTCGEFDPNGTWNTALDIQFTIRTLLLPPEEQDLELVRSSEPDRGNAVLAKAVADATTTPQGRARLALAAAFADIPGWFAAHEPRPTTTADRVTAQANWLQAFIIFAGPKERAIDMEPRAGGNPSTNVGVDYRHQLARSTQAKLVREAYRAAPALDLGADLDRLAATPRIAADPPAVAYMDRVAIPTGRTPVPVITLHTPQDGGAIAGHERWYAGQVRRHGDPDKLRQLYVDRGMHCAFSDAEEILTLRALFDRIDTGRWPNLSPHRLNQAAGTFGDPYQFVLDIPASQDKPMPPAFVRFTPAPFPRPSR